MNSDSFSSEERYFANEQLNKFKNLSLAKNIQRKSKHIDIVTLLEGIPLFSYLEINPTELCNRKCVFCPRVDSDRYPNQNLHINKNIITKLNIELININYTGTVAFCGYGEPTLTRDFQEIVRTLSGRNFTKELVTNGDFLKTADSILDLINAGISFFVVSMYDGEHQIEKFQKLFQQAGVTEDKYILRDRWHDETDEYGLKLTNRASEIKLQGQSEINRNRPCFYPAYSLLLDWNGDVYLCPQDWQKKVKSGNFYQSSILEIWNSPELSRRRLKLIHGKRTEAPCKDCNADGCVHGFNHAEKWINPQTGNSEG